MTEAIISGPPSKISEDDLKLLHHFRGLWLAAQFNERFKKGQLDGCKQGLYSKYGVDIDDYFIDGETGAIKKRRVRKE